MENNFLSESDTEFDIKLTAEFQKHSKIHWTPEQVIDKTIQWLKDYKAEHILDIGSGVGKFCLLGAQKSNLKFTGVELRKNLHEEALELKAELQLENVNFINENITNVHFSEYDAIYYFNPFCEQLCTADWIDHNTTFSSSNFHSYEAHVFTQLIKLNKGTKIVKFCSSDFELPHSYFYKESAFEGMLQLWVKEE